MVSTAVVPVLALPGECEGPEPAVSSSGHGSYGMVVENNLGAAIEVWTMVKMFQWCIEMFKRYGV